MLLTSQSHSCPWQDMNEHTLYPRDRDYICVFTSVSAGPNTKSGTWKMLNNYLSDGILILENLTFQRKDLIIKTACQLICSINFLTSFFSYPLKHTHTHNLHTQCKFLLFKACNPKLFAYLVLL